MIGWRQGGHVGAFRYDAEGRLLETRDTDGRTRRVERDAAGRVVRTVDEDGRAVEIERDGEGRPIRVTEVGTDGLVLATRERAFGGTGDTFTETVTVHDGRRGAPTVYRSEVARDGSSNGIRTTDAGDGDVATVRGDPFGPPRTLIDGDGTRRDYNRDGRLESVTDPRGNVTRYAYDDFGRQVRESSPDAGAVTWRHDASDNTIERIDAHGRRSSWTWDAAGRRTRRESPDGTSTWAYDATSGLVSEARNAATRERFEHDAEGNPVLHVRTIGGHVLATRYTRDARGRIVRETLPDGRTLRHRYHAAGQNRGELLSISRETLFGLSSDALVDEVDTRASDGTSGYRSLDGRRTTMTHGPGGEIVAIDIGRRLSWRYDRDGRGRLASIVENGQDQRYGYESGRLVSADTSTGRDRYEYDAVGNRVRREHVSPDGERTVTRYGYPSPGLGNRLRRIERDTGERVEHVQLPDGSTALVRRSGPPGRPAAIPLERAIEYDAEARRTRVIDDGELVAEYAYNPFRERVAKTVHARDGSTTTTYFLYEDSRLVGEVDGGGRLVRHYVYLGDRRPVAMLAADRAYAIHADHLGTPRLVADADGRTVWEARYRPFGEIELSTERLTLNLRLPGQYADAETGTHYNYYRDYDPALGRYLTSDPIGLADGVDAYGYVGGDPLGSFDALGLARAGLAAVPIARPTRRGVTRPGARRNPRNRAARIDRYEASREALRRLGVRVTSATPVDYVPSWEEVFDIEHDLYLARYDYAGKTECDADFDADVWQDAVDQALGYEAVWQPIVSGRPIPRATLDDIRERYDPAYRDYRANGGTDTFEGWLSDGMPDGETSPSRDSRQISEGGRVGADDMSNATRLRAQLALEEAGILTPGGYGLAETAIADSDRIAISGGVLTNPRVVAELTSDGSNIEDWGKFTTDSVQLSTGQSVQVHFYMNLVTGEVNTNIDFKIKGIVR